MKKNIIKILTIILMLFMLANITGFVYADEINPGDFSGIYTKTGVSDLDDNSRNFSFSSCVISIRNEIYVI